jgi:hypothetical protein
MVIPAFLESPVFSDGHDGIADYLRKKGGETGLPKYVHFHVTLLVNVPSPKIHALEASVIQGIYRPPASFDCRLQGRILKRFRINQQYFMRQVSPLRMKIAALFSGESFMPMAHHNV